jgi:hypothetical protein
VSQEKSADNQRSSDLHREGASSRFDLGSSSTPATATLAERNGPNPVESAAAGLLLQPLAESANPEQRQTHLD